MFSGLISVCTNSHSSCRYCNPINTCLVIIFTSAGGTPVCLCLAISASKFSPNGSKTMHIWTSEEEDEDGEEESVLTFDVSCVCGSEPAKAASDCAVGEWLKESRKETTWSRPGWTGFAAITCRRSLISSRAVSAYRPADLTTLRAEWRFVLEKVASKVSIYLVFLWNTK